MEEVLDLYEQPYDPLLPMVRFDERPCQLIGAVKDPLPVKPGQVWKIDSHYERRGICHVLMGFEPLGGWRDGVTEVPGTPHGTAVSAILPNWGPRPASTQQ
jgi:hypothetical protein